ncbi:unnamed protein product [Adineta ricciae]|uniref:Uncharacterized protein n=1 Tax=Adineta ricciae TaxID=249248 RepID=A0A816B0M4_ADIRI|nr:unnamed protein product [Adineta ricciae]CAF1602585.1 unnamed protein product [Adineta ricciae]
MALQSGSPSVRDDYRCSICRQQNAFRCEHDTRYRDQFLDNFGQENRSAAAKTSLDAYNAANQDRMNDRRRTPPARPVASNGISNRSTIPQKTKTKKKKCTIL